MMNIIQQEDDDFCAIILVNLRKHCANCQCIETPLWRKGWYNPSLKRDISLCNSCGLRFNKKQYCPVCMYVYKKNDTNNKHWLTCIKCNQSIHKKCLKTIIDGKYTFKNYQYICSDCNLEIKQS